MVRLQVEFRGVPTWRATERRRVEISGRRGSAASGIPKERRYRTEARGDMSAARGRGRRAGECVARPRCAGPERLEVVTVVATTSPGSRLPSADSRIPCISIRIELQDVAVRVVYSEVCPAERPLSRRSVRLDTGCL